MFAVIRTGGKQYKVAPNDIIEVEKLNEEVGAIILINDLVLFNDGSKDELSKFEGISVSAEVLKQKKGDKVLVFKKKRRHNYRRKNGHRQPITVLKIAQIGKDLKAKAAPVKTAEDAAKSEKQTKAKAAAPKKAEPKAKEASTEKKASAKTKTTTAKAKKQ